MKYLNPKSTIVLAAVSTMFMFTGCGSNVSQAYNDASQSKSTSAVESTNKSSGKTNKNKQKQTKSKSKSKKNSLKVVSKVSDEQRKEFLDAINNARANGYDCGAEGEFPPAPALKWSNELDNAAYEHSYDLASSNTFSHTGSGQDTDITAKAKHLDRGSKFYERIRQNGYVQYRTVGENIAAGYETVQEVVDAWLESDHHCANLMSKNYTDVGMSLVVKDGTEYGYYWSQEFGTKQK